MIKDYFGDGTRLGMKIEYAIQPKILGTAASKGKGNKFRD